MSVKGGAAVSPEAEPQLRELEEIAIELAEAAGRSVLARAAAGERAVTYKSTLTDLVTDIDRAIETELVAALRRRRPHDAVRGEEGGVHATAGTGAENRDVGDRGAEEGSGAGNAMSTDSDGRGAVEWVLDPIDGTVNFVLGIPWFSVSVAACIDGRPVAGCVADPNRGETFHARLGGGSFLRSGAGSTRLAGPRDVSLAEAVMGTGFAYSAPVRVRQARVLAELVGQLGNIRRLGSAALDLCYVGAGRLDAYFEAGLADWDMAAGMLVASEAGVRVGALEGRPFNDGVLAAPARLFDELASRLTDLGAHRVFDGLRG